MAKKKLNTPEAAELRGIRKEKFKSVVNKAGNIAKGAALGLAAGSAAAGINKSRGKTDNLKTASTALMGMGTAYGATAGAAGANWRTPEERKSERTRIKTLKPIVRAQRKNARGK